MALGITIRKGASGFTLSGPEGTADLSPLTRPELGTVGRMVSDAMGLKDEERPRPRLSRNRRPRPQRSTRLHRNHNRKD